MGSAFIVFWGILFAPVAFVMGVGLSYLVPAIRSRTRPSNATEGKPIGCLTRGSQALLFAFIIDAGVCICAVLLMAFRSNNYWEDAGFGDFWRMPLEPPYQLEMIDSLDEASIGEWKSNKWHLGGVTKYVKEGDILAGRFNNSGETRTNGYFLFDCKTGRLEKFDEEKAFNSACAERGLAQPATLNSVKENWNLYWDDPNRRRK